jgi:hypothetical protein
VLAEDVAHALACGTDAGDYGTGSGTAGRPQSHRGAADRRRRGLTPRRRSVGAMPGGAHLAERIRAG